jgi:hypothetical protein
MRWCRPLGFYIFKKQFLFGRFKYGKYGAAKDTWSPRFDQNGEVYMFLRDRL